MLILKNDLSFKWDFRHWNWVGPIKIENNFWSLLFNYCKTERDDQLVQIPTSIHKNSKYITKSIFNNLLSALMNIGMRSMQELIFLARWVEVGQFVNLMFSFLSPKKE